MSLSPIQLAALQLAINHTEPGIVFIDEPKRLPGLDGIVARLEEFDSVAAATFIAAQDIQEPPLQVAITRTDFAQERLIAEAGQCVRASLKEIKRHLLAAQNEQK